MPQIERRSPILGCLAAYCLLALSIAFSDLAQAGPTDTTRNFQIKPQTLKAALDAFSEQSGLQLFYSAELVAGLETPGIRGTMTIKTALKTLLKDTELRYRLLDENTLSLEKRDRGELSVENLMSAAGEFTLLAAETDLEPEDGPIEQEDLMVRGAPLSGYSVLNANTATKTDTPIIDTPVSVQVVPRTVMDDQKSTRVKDVLENVSGVRPQPTLGTGNGYIIRGFRNDRVYRNGLLSSFPTGFEAEFDVGNVQSVEVLKGPAAVLYGRIEPGGLINITTKKPFEAPYYSLEQQFGSYDFYRTQWDATGAISNDESLLYRFTGAYQNNNSFRDFVFTDRVLVNPTITWRPTESTNLMLSIEGLDQDFKADNGIPAIGNRPAPIPISRSVDDPNTPIGHLSHTFVSTEINHLFNEDWAIHNRFLAGFNDIFTTFISNSPTGNNVGSDGLLKRNVFGQTSSFETFNTNLDLTGKFNLGFSKHDILVGVDYFRANLKYHFYGEFVESNPALDFNIFNPSYGIDPALIQETLSRHSVCCTDTSFNVFQEDWFGVYFQDQITLWDRLHILGGGRYDWATTGRGRGTSFSEAEAVFPSRKDQDFSPRVGILYQPWYFLSVYGNWTTSFGANNAPADNGSSFDPQRGEQFEAGLKTQLFDDRLIATLAFYQLTKDNILVADLSTLDLNDRIANKQRSQGIELDVTGQITDEISMIASYAFTNTRVLEDHVAEGDPTNAGHKLPNVPKNAGSLFLKYDANGYNSQEGFNFGVGGIAAGQRQGDLANSFQLPGFVRVDAFAAYRMKVGPTKIIAQFNIRNLLDKAYYESSDSGSNGNPRRLIYPGAPLTAIGSLRVEF